MKKTDNNTCKACEHHFLICKPTGFEVNHSVALKLNHTTLLQSNQQCMVSDQRGQNKDKGTKYGKKGQQLHFSFRHVFK